MSASSSLISSLRSAACTLRRADTARQIASISSRTQCGASRCYATAQPRLKNGKEKSVKPGKHKPPPERDSAGALVYKKQDKKGGVFRPMPAGQLSHPLFRGEATEMTLPLFSPALLTPEMVGKPLAFSVEGSSPFNKFGITKKTLLEYRLASCPYSVVRDATLELTQRIERATDSSSAENRVVLTGTGGCGKSVLLMQGVAHCYEKEWLTIYIPRAVHLVDSTTPYVYDLRTRTYLQYKASFQLLQRFLGTNAKFLDGLATSVPIDFDKRTVPAGSPLTSLIKLGLDEQSLSPAVLEALFAELAAQTKYPVVLAIDDFQSLYCMSRYKDPHFNSLRPFHLSLPRLLMEYASGKRVFSRGMILGAITDSDPSWKPSLELREALSLPHGQPTSPYDKRSQSLAEFTKGLQPFVVPSRLSINEAASIFDFWKADKAYNSAVSDELFLSKYTESSGNAREFVWKGLLANFDPR